LDEVDKRDERIQYHLSGYLVRNCDRLEEAGQEKVLGRRMGVFCRDLGVESHRDFRNHRVEHQKSKLAPRAPSLRINIRLKSFLLFRSTNQLLRLLQTFFCHLVLSPVMDFSQLNSAEQAHMTKIIEKKQVLDTSYTLQQSLNTITALLDARLPTSILRPRGKMF